MKIPILLAMLFADLATRQCAIIDSVLDYDAASATTKQLMLI